MFTSHIILSYSHCLENFLNFEVGLLPANYLSLSSSDNVFDFPLLRRGIFAEYRILSCQFFSLDI